LNRENISCDPTLLSEPVTAANTEDKREKIQALSLAKECYSMKLDLLTNATVVDDAIKFVKNEGLKEPDYNEYQDQLEEKPDEETGEITTNHVF
jgi:hypothetical protein